MIVFDLRCGSGHVFEGWFASSAAWEEQRAAGLVECPLCGATQVEKAVMAPNVAAKGNQRQDTVPTPRQRPVPMASAAPTLPPAVREAMAALAQAQAKALASSEWVGDDFARRARAMHAGDETEAAIHGRTDPETARELMEDGVPVMPLLVPVVPPEQLN
ncbi:DUF1178 family protein [Sphingomonas sp. BGYR3]|uniref:DUF1178 family protein n=1 Tax=Sphingomonas sp. BGYR3 TaxID=2975483 RepID=UPI0021A94D62|nr:DUF1178 family protein [Sphingomonas sp. BGYR3]MDG5489578.1 DUF1178 family protein [Sphingomonas sp. BGYR3]